MPQGFAEIFALLPAWEVNLVMGTGLEKTLGKLEDTVSFNLSVSTADNKSGYPKKYQSIIVTERNSEVSGTLSDLDPAIFSYLNDYTFSTPEDGTGNPLGTLIDMANNTTALPDYGLVLRGWYQAKILLEIRFERAKAFIDGNIDVHNVASRVPFKIMPVSDGKMFVGANEGIMIKKPATVNITIT